MPTGFHLTDDRQILFWRRHRKLAFAGWAGGEEVLDGVRSAENASAEKDTTRVLEDQPRRVNLRARHIARHKTAEQGLQR